MNALDLLKDQHTEVDELIEQLENSDDNDEKEQLFEEMANKLAAHSKIEETLFYPAVMAKQTEEKLIESVEEHLQIKRLLADMMELDVDDDHFDAKLSVLKEELQHHAHEEEEKKLFPQVKKLMSADDLDGLGNEMLASFEQLVEDDVAEQVPNETSQAAPIG